MYKEIIITIIIVVLVVVGDILTQNYTEACVEEMNNNLESLKEIVINNSNYKEVLSNISSIENRWNEMKEKLVYYLEHDELEKVNTQLTEIRGYSEADEIKESISKIENCKFLLKHIKDKEAFNFKNIF